MPGTVLEISQQIHALKERIKQAETWLRSFMRQSALCKKIAAIDAGMFRRAYRQAHTRPQTV
jgi:hypothetical protein